MIKRLIAILLCFVLVFTIAFLPCSAAKAKEKYPVARKVWNYLRNKGYNAYVCAGIIGNMMAECGGQTLNLKPQIYAHGYYGLCMWSSYYYPKVQGASVEKQLTFLYKTMKNEFNTFGYKYYRGFNYAAFKKLKNCKSAALAFAKCYERCASGSYTIRQKNATVAYKYFTTH